LRNCCLYGYPLYVIVAYFSTIILFVFFLLLDCGKVFLIVFDPVLVLALVVFFLILDSEFLLVVVFFSISGRGFLFMKGFFAVI